MFITVWLISVVLLLSEFLLNLYGVHYNQHLTETVKMEVTSPSQSLIHPFFRPFVFKTRLIRSVFGLGLACQAEGQCCHTKKSTLAKIFTKKTSKSANRMPLRYKKKDPLK